jgi:hypothetical protein
VPPSTSRASSGGGSSELTVPALADSEGAGTTLRAVDTAGTTLAAAADDDIAGTTLVAATADMVGAALLGVGADDTAGAALGPEDVAVTEPATNGTALGTDTTMSGTNGMVFGTAGAESGTGGATPGAFGTDLGDGLGGDTAGRGGESFDDPGADDVRRGGVATAV